MSEIQSTNRIWELKREIIVRTLHPEALEDYRPEDERTKHINHLKEELGSLGVDAETFFVETIAQNLGIPIVNRVIEVDFPQQVG